MSTNWSSKSFCRQVKPAARAADRPTMERIRIASHRTTLAGEARFPNPDLRAVALNDQIQTI